MATVRFMAFMAILFLSAVAGAHEGDEPITEDDSVEELTVTEELDDVTDDSQPQSAVVSFLGGLHPAVIHFPIAWMTLLCLAEIIGLVIRRPSWHRAGRYLLIATVMSVIPAVVTGLLQSDRVSFTDPYTGILELHRNLNFLVGALALAALLARSRLNTAEHKPSRTVYLLLIVGATMVLLYSGYLGGRLVHG